MTFNPWTQLIWRLVVLLIAMVIAVYVVGGITTYLFLWTGPWFSAMISFFSSWGGVLWFTHDQHKKGSELTADHLHQHYKITNDEGEKEGITRYNTTTIEYMELYLDQPQGNFFQAFLVETLGYYAFLKSGQRSELVGKFAETGTESHKQKIRYQHREQLGRSAVKAEYTGTERETRQNYKEMEDAGYPTDEGIDAAFQAEHRIAQQEIAKLIDDKAREVLKEDLINAQTYDEVMLIKAKLETLNSDNKGLTGET